MLVKIGGCASEATSPCSGLSFCRQKQFINRRKRQCGQQQNTILSSSDAVRRVSPQP
jgi:hypothetical protein